RDERPRLVAQPLAHAVRDLALVVRLRVTDGDMEEIGRDFGTSSGIDRERQLLAAEHDRRAGFPFARHHVAPARAPFRERADDPRRTLGERGLDVTQADPARRAHREALEMHLHADRAAPSADQAVIDRLAGEADAAQLTVGRPRRGTVRAIEPRTGAHWCTPSLAAIAAAP